MYDIGGGEQPVNDQAIVIDIMAKEDFPFANKFISADITDADSLKGLAPTDEVFVGRTFRYVGNKDGFLEGDKIQVHQLKNAAHNVGALVALEGSITIVDHPDILVPVVAALGQIGFTLTRMDIIDYHDEDYPAEYEAVLQRKN